MYHSFIKSGYKNRLRVPIKVPVIFLLLSIFWNSTLQSSQELHSTSGLLFILSYKAIQNWSYTLDDCLPEEEEGVEETNLTTIPSSDWNRRELYLKYANTLMYDEYGAWWPVSDQGAMQSAFDQTWKMEFNDIGSEEWSEVCNFPDYSEVEGQACPGILNCPLHIEYKGEVLPVGQSKLDTFRCLVCMELPIDDDEVQSIEGCPVLHVFCGKCADEFRKSNPNPNEIYECTACNTRGSFKKEARLRNEFRNIEIYCPRGCGKKATIGFIFDDHLRTCSLHTACRNCNEIVENQELEAHLKDCFLKGDREASQDLCLKTITTLSIENQILTKKVNYLECQDETECSRKCPRLSSESTEPVYESKDKSMIYLGRKMFSRTPVIRVTNPDGGKDLEVYCFQPYVSYDLMPSLASLVRINFIEPIPKTVFSHPFTHMGYTFYLSLNYCAVSSAYVLAFHITSGVYDEDLVWPFKKNVRMLMLTPTGDVENTWRLVAPSDRSEREQKPCYAKRFTKPNFSWSIPPYVNCSTLRRLRVDGKYLHVCFYFEGQ